MNDDKRTYLLWRLRVIALALIGFGIAYLPFFFSLMTNRIDHEWFVALGSLCILVALIDGLGYFNRNKYMALLDRIHRN